jgi:hypothetical protein
VVVARGATIKQAKDAAGAVAGDRRRAPAAAATEAPARKRQRAQGGDDDEAGGDDNDRPRAFAGAGGAAGTARLPIKGRDGVVRQPERALEPPEVVRATPPTQHDDNDNDNNDHGEGEAQEDDEDEAERGSGRVAPWASEVGTAAVSAAGARTVSVAAHRERSKVLLATLATDILEDPEGKVCGCAPEESGGATLTRRGGAVLCGGDQVELLGRLGHVARDADVAVQRLAWLTQLAVFKDIVPGCACSLALAPPFCR